MDKQQQEEQDRAAAERLQALEYGRDTSMGCLVDSEGDDLWEADEPYGNVDAPFEDLFSNHQPAPQCEEGMGGFARQEEDPPEVHFEDDPETFRQILSSVKNYKMCKHGRRKCDCKECGGSLVCKHGKRKSRCKECGGNEICQHDRRKSDCKECGGSRICQHGRRKDRCKECKAASKDDKNDGGDNMRPADQPLGNMDALFEDFDWNPPARTSDLSVTAEHPKHTPIADQAPAGNNKRKCLHGKRKDYCKECGGSQICQHGKIKSACKECSSDLFCLHGKRKYNCRECGGSRFCQHGKEKYKCKECKAMKNNNGGERDPKHPKPN
jgi:hypothetical protein